MYYASGRSLLRKFKGGDVKGKAFRILTARVLPARTLDPSHKGIHRSGFGYSRDYSSITKRFVNTQESDGFVNPGAGIDCRDRRDGV